MSNKDNPHRQNYASGAKWEPIVGYSRAAVGRAHGEVFGTVRPATSMVEVCALISPDMLVEIEADAFLGEQDQTPEPPAH